MVTRKPAAKRPTSAKQRAIDEFEAKFGKTFGPQSFERSNKVAPYEVVSTSSIELDYALGSGGYVEDHMTEFHGPDNVGKTTMALIAIANAQRKYPGRMAAFIDVEYKLDRRWAQAHGVDLAMLYHVTPANAEDAVDMTMAMIEEGDCCFVVFDSIGALIGKEEQDKSAGEKTVGIVARLVTKLVRDAAAAMKNRHTHLLLINQQRANIKPTGGDTIRSGGFAVGYACIHRVKFRFLMAKPMQLGSGDAAVKVGIKIACKVEKNQVAPQRTAQVTLITAPSPKYGMQIGVGGRSDEAFNVGKSTGVIRRKGITYVFPDGTEARAEKGARELLEADPALVELVRTEVIKYISSGGASEATETDDDEPAASDDETTDETSAQPVVDALDLENLDI